MLDLLALVLAVEKGWSALQRDLDVLNEYSVDYRYPGKAATKAEAKAALAHCRAVRKAARLSLGLP